MSPSGEGRSRAIDTGWLQRSFDLFRMPHTSRKLGWPGHLLMRHVSQAGRLCANPGVDRSLSHELQPRQTWSVAEAGLQ